MIQENGYDHYFNMNADNTNDEIYTRNTLLRLRDEAISGNESAASKLGDLYYWGNLVREDMRLAKSWFSFAAKKNEPTAIFRLAIIYFNLWHCENPGLSEEEQNIERNRSFDLFKKATKLGIEGASYYLGKCHSLGIGTKENDKKAFRWFKHSKKLGTIEGIFELGYCYYLGLGTKINSQKAIQLFRQISDYHEEAQYYLGISYLEGKAIPSSDTKGIFWLEKSASNGFERAQDVLDNFTEFKRFLCSSKTEFSW